MSESTSASLRKINSGTNSRRNSEADSVKVENYDHSAKTKMAGYATDVEDQNSIPSNPLRVRWIQKKTSSAKKKIGSTSLSATYTGHETNMARSRRTCSRSATGRHSSLPGAPYMQSVFERVSTAHLLAEMFRPHYRRLGQSFFTGAGAYSIQNRRADIHRFAWHCCSSTK